MTLDFRNTGSTSAIKSLSSNIQKTKSLKQLDLNLSGCDFINDDALVLISQGLAELKDLVSLSINLTYVNKLTDQALRSFVASFPMKLTHLALKLGHYGLDGDAFEIFAVGIQNLPILYSVDLSFARMDDFNYDAGFRVLCDALKDSVSLRNVSLEVRPTKGAKEKIKELEKTKNVTMNWGSDLRFSSCRAIIHYKWPQE